MTTKLRTPTETLMAALAECETAENVLIVMRHNDDISWHATSNSRSDILGMTEFASACVRGRIMREEMAEGEEKL